MNSSRSNRRADAFTLLELLCVIAIIAILASLILAAASQAQSRARRIGCVSHLQQLGVAFQLFMHDHGDRFPMAVPLAEGGSQEYVRNGFAVGGEFYFSYHHFQALSNELVLATLLVCPTDTRLPAASFAGLQNSNVSYFVGVKAEIAKPDSILAGDRNLKANSSPNPSILQGTPDNRFWWTREMHQFKGNILFADGHVEEWNNAMLSAGAGAQLAMADLFMPSVVPDANHPASPDAGYGSSYPGGSGNGAASMTPSADRPAERPLNDSVTTRNPSGQYRLRQPAEDPAGPQNPPVVARTNPPDPGRISTRAPVTVTVSPEETESAMSTFDRHLVKHLRRILFGTYLLVLLLILLRMAYLWWRRSKRKREQREPAGL